MGPYIYSLWFLIETTKFERKNLALVSLAQWIECPGFIWKVIWLFGLISILAKLVGKTWLAPMPKM